MGSPTTTTVVVDAAVAAGDHRVIPRKKALGAHSQVTYVRPVARSGIGPRTVGPRPRRRARPILLKKRRAAYCWSRPVN
jgi:hypothetical protein